MSRLGSKGNGHRHRLRFAVVGQGYFAQAAVLPAFKRATDCELHTIFSEDSTKLRALKRKYAVTAALGYDQYDAHLRSGRVDAVYIALPNDMHCDYAVRAARAGVHVLCEKPIAVNSRDAERMVTACQENEVKLMVAYRLHFEAATLEAIARIQAGAIGAPRFFVSSFAMQVMKDNIRTQRERGGGPLLDLGIYCVNAARALFRAEPTEAVAMSATMRSDPRFNEIDEQVSAVLRFPGERLAQFTCSFGAYDHSSLTVIGEKGRVSLDPAYEHSEGMTVSLERKGQRVRRKSFAKRDQVAAELDAFAGYVRDGRDPEPSGQEGLADLRVLEAIHRSIVSGRTETIASVARARRPSKSQAVRRTPHAMPSLVNAAPPGRR